MTAPTVAELARRDLFWKVRTDPRRADLDLGTRAGVLPYFVPVGSPLGREVVVDGARRLMFGSNNYLGLADDPRVIEAARAAVTRYGTGCTGSRLMNGTLELNSVRGVIDPSTRTSASGSRSSRDGRCGATWR